jgi:hypothetical protein
VCQRRLPEVDPLNMSHVGSATGELAVDGTSNADAHVMPWTHVAAQDLTHELKDSKNDHDQLESTYRRAAPRMLDGTHASATATEAGVIPSHLHHRYHVLESGFSYDLAAAMTKFRKTVKPSTVEQMKDRFILQLKRVELVSIDSINGMPASSYTSEALPPAAASASNTRARCTGIGAAAAAVETQMHVMLVAGRVHVCVFLYEDLCHDMYGDPVLFSTTYDKLEYYQTYLS